MGRSKTAKTASLHPAETQTIGVSLAIPGPWAAQLKQARHQAGDVRADTVPPHVTLLPPTEVRPADRDALEAHLEKVAREVDPFRITLRGTGTFRPTSDVVFVAIAEGVSNCEQVESLIRSGPVVRALQFPYHPHVTIAHDVPADGLDRAFVEWADFEAAFEVTEFELYEHGNDGVWRPVRRYRFGG